MQTKRPVHCWAGMTWLNLHQVSARKSFFCVFISDPTDERQKCQNMPDSQTDCFVHQCNLRFSTQSQPPLECTFVCSQRPPPLRSHAHTGRSPAAQPGHPAGGDGGAGGAERRGEVDGGQPHPRPARPDGGQRLPGRRAGPRVRPAVPLHLRPGRGQPGVAALRSTPWRLPPRPAPEGEGLCKRRLSVKRQEPCHN